MSETKWINVGQRLPKNDDLVIVTNIENLWVCCGYYRSSNRKWYNQFEGPKWDVDIIPTHWMPLPEQPSMLIKASEKPTYFTKQLRNALADYIASEGCSCCQNVEEHEKAAARLAKLLRVPKYKDGSGYDFYKYKTKQP